jgi:hypothetical protein
VQGVDSLAPVFAHREVEGSMSVTNPKLIPNGAGVQWASFSGFSILFDNPWDDSDDYSLGWKKIAVKSQVFFTQLSTALRGTTFKPKTFVPLPATSYHVTLWDGLNQSNVDEIKVEKTRSHFAELLRKLPDTASELSTLSPYVGSYETHMCDRLRSSGSIRFSFKELAVWGSEVLVAKLAATQTGILDSLRQLRADLNSAFEKQFPDIHMRSDYEPHVSLGYFTNKQAGNFAMDHVPRLNKIFANHVNEKLYFTRAKQYYFLDMVTFLREAPTGSEWP